MFLRELSQFEVKRADFNFWDPNFPYVGNRARKTKLKIQAISHG